MWKNKYGYQIQNICDNHLNFLCIYKNKNFCKKQEILKWS